ncbi:MAG: tripartite tricarboxylate transporter TctB family protein [Candidatus Sedimenticola sp. 6PFRAG5]
MSLKNVIGAILLLIVGLIYGYLGTQLPDRGIPNVPGPAFFPGLVATLIVVLAITLLIKGLAGLKKEPAMAGGFSVPVWPLMMLAWWFCFVVLLPHAGFLLAGIPFFAGLMLMCEQRRWITVVIASISIPVVLFYLFRSGLNILLPTGGWM